MNPLIKILGGLFFCASAGLASTLTSVPINYVCVGLMLACGVIVLYTIGHFRDDY